ncbi:hypothetical protein [Cyanobium sp. WAJ14-Wanaka]|uniref:hypothetical protein n=1 Tax=Cyanobium sp. WAJ14-Wanaka TaxID=2823725 RepID=UPI0020CC9C02|nr:hypothetical protein [Cyanobium sp. WAJ14-Wanaka]MCP9774819.1 hypothetical protein [Cyanobium sp. WAJ14-Wanaka]
MPNPAKNWLAITRRRGLWISAFVVALVLLVSNLDGSLASATEQTLPQRFEPANTAELLSKANAIPVKVGAYIENYHDLSLQGRRFVAEGYYWLEWPDSLEEILDANEIAPGDIVEITNQIDEWDSKIRSVTPGARKLPNGNNYYQVRFSGNFYIPDLNLKLSPFESLTLPLIIEVQDDQLALQNSNVVLVGDQGKDQLLGSYSEIDGYKISSTALEPMVHSYGTSWGQDKGNLTYPAIQVVTKLRSSGFSSFLTWVFPLLIVVGIVLLAPSVAGELGDIRLAIPSTGMLTLIFLQQTYDSTLPPLDYLTFLDWLYAAGYLISIATFLLFVWGTNAYQGADEDQKITTLTRINKVDTIFQLGSVISMAVVASLAWKA